MQVSNERSAATAYLKGSGRIKRWWLRKRQPVDWHVNLQQGIIRMPPIDVQWSRPRGLLARIVDHVLSPDTITVAVLEVDGQDVYEWRVYRQLQEGDVVCVTDNLVLE